MAVGYTTFYLSNGQQVGVYITTTQAVNTDLRCSITGTPTAASPFVFTVMSRACITDIVESANVSGEMEIMKDGIRTGIKIVQSAQWEVARYRMIVPRWCFEPGHQYGFLQTVVHA